MKHSIIETKKNVQTGAMRGRSRTPNHICKIILIGRSIVAKEYTKKNLQTSSSLRGFVKQYLFVGRLQLKNINITEIKHDLKQ